MPRSVMLIVAAVIGVALLGVYGIPWFLHQVVGERMEVRVTILSAFVDNEVGVPGAKNNETVPRIVTAMEIVFPYGSEPEGFGDMSVRADDGTPVDVNWGSQEIEKIPIEDKSITKYIIRQAFFPTDFKQGMLRNSRKEFCYFKMPKLPFNAPNAE